MTSIRALKIQRKPSKTEPRTHLFAQIKVANLLFSLLESRSRIAFFDETTLSHKNFKKTGLGTSVMKPHVTFYGMRKFHILTMFTLEGRVAIQFSTNPNNSTSIIDFFRQAIPHFINHEDHRKLTVFLDNLIAQKTAAFKNIVNKLPICLCYTVPCTSYLNLIEDFFLNVKQIFKDQYYQGDKILVRTFIKGLKNELEERDRAWMVRKLAFEVERRIMMDDLFADMIKSDLNHPFSLKLNPIQNSNNMIIEDDETPLKKQTMKIKI